MNPAAHYREVQRASANDCIARHSDLVRRIAHHLTGRLVRDLRLDPHPRLDDRRDPPWRLGAALGASPRP
jgi:hypothetical protein